MAGGFLSALGRGLREGASSFLTLDAQRRAEERQRAQDLIQKQLLDAQMANMEADNTRAAAAEARAARAEARAAKAEDRDHFREVLLNLTEPTAVDDETAATMRELGLSPFVESRLAGRTMDVEVAPGVKVQGQTLEGGNFAKPMETPQLRIARENLELERARGAEQIRQFNETHGRLVQRDQELDASREAQRAMQQELAQARLEATLAQYGNSEANSKAIRRVQLLELLAKVSSPDITATQEQRDAMAEIASMARRELAKLEQSTAADPSGAAAARSRASVLPRVPTLGPVASDREADFLSRVRNR